MQAGNNLILFKSQDYLIVTCTGIKTMKYLLAADLHSINYRTNTFTINDQLFLVNHTTMVQTKVLYVISMEFLELTHYYIFFITLFTAVTYLKSTY